jgi:hypothetical protein
MELVVPLSGCLHIFPRVITRNIYYHCSEIGIGEDQRRIRDGTVGILFAVIVV